MLIIESLVFLFILYFLQIFLKIWADIYDDFLSKDPRQHGYRFA